MWPEPSPAVAIQALERLSRRTSVVLIVASSALLWYGVIAMVQQL